MFNYRISIIDLENVCIFFKAVEFSVDVVI
jgi:hypothetical protein